MSHRVSDATDPAWYRTYYAEAVTDFPWTQGTKDDVDFALSLCERSGAVLDVLDLACGDGRHSIEMARRGHRVTGVDISPELIARARERAAELGVEVTWITADIRDIDLRACADLVLNLWEGAIGYLENDDENDKIFAVIAQALRFGGCQIAGPLINRSYVAQHAPIHFEEVHDGIRLETTIEMSAAPGRIIDQCRVGRSVDGVWQSKNLPTIDYRVYDPAELSQALRTHGLDDARLFCHPTQVALKELSGKFEYWITTVRR